MNATLTTLNKHQTRTTKKNKAIENLLTQVQHLKEQHKDISKEEVEAIEEDMKQSAMLTEEGWADFNIMFEKAFPGMIVKFREKLPELADIERRYFKLLKLGLNSKDIAGMFGIDDAGVIAIRKSLVEKLELTDDAEIEILLESI